MPLNVIFGTNNPDTLAGTAGDDEIFGWSQSNPLGDEGPASDNDTIAGGDGDDILHGGSGNDALDGGAGVDTADYGHKTASVVVTLNGAANAIVEVGGVAEDTIRNIENVAGGSGADTLVGDALANALSGGDGSDLLRGGGGPDTLDGGAGVDTVDYGDRAASSVVVALNGASNATVTVGGVAEDTIRNIENVTGGAGADTLRGDGLANVLSGGGGDDVLRGGGGADALDGGAGFDGADYRDKSASVVVQLNGAANATVTVGGVAEDVIRNIEGVAGGAGADTLTGDSSANLLSGGGGNDTLRGGGGTDTLDGGAGSDWAGYQNETAPIVVTLNGATDAVVTVGGVAEDTIRNIENIAGGSGADILTGDGWANVFRGGGGGDALDGGAGGDTADYGDRAASSVVAHLNGASNATVTVGGVAEDTIRNIENLTGGGGADTFIGDDFANVLSGGGGDDILRGARGADRLDGGAGVDTADYGDKQVSTVAVRLNGSSDAIVTIGGVAEDTIRNIENVTGGAAADTLVGDGLANVLSGGGGDDVLRGGGGNDTLDGGAGVDTADFLYNAAPIVVHLSGASNTIVTIGGVAEDTIRNIENVRGGFAADTLTGDGLANFLYGDDGNDTIDGGDGNDTIIGGAGDDTINGGDGNDVVYWGQGYVVPGSGVDTVDGGDGVDTINGGGTEFGAVTFDLANGTYNNGAGFTETWRNFENYTNNGIGDERVIGTTGANSITTGSGNNIIDGGLGDDTLDGGGGADILRGGGGADTLDGGADVDRADYSYLGSSSIIVQLNGASNAIVTIGGVAEDTIRNIENVTGGAAADTLVGDDFANVIDGFLGDDVLDGGGGNDILIGDGGVDTLDGGAGVDRADYSYLGSSSIVVQLNGASNAIVTIGGVAEDTIRNIENVMGGEAADTLIGDDIANVLFGRRGDDALQGGLGDDRLYGDAGGDTLDGGDGNDVLRGGDGADALDGGTGVDRAEYSDKTVSVVVTLSGAAVATVIVGGVAEDTIRNIENVIGGGGADTLIGDGLANVLSGGAGADTLDGGAGDDILSGGGGSGADTIYGGAGNDVVYWGPSSPFDARYIDGGEGVDTINGGGASFGAVTFDLANGTYNNGASFTETWRNFENYTNNGIGDERVIGTTGANSITTGSGNNIIDGGLGDDTLDGGGGNDTLTGGGGNDTLTGGDGDDTFAFEPAFGQDLVRDFFSEDKLRIDHTIFADWTSLLSHAQQVGSDTVITASATDRITLHFFALASLNQSQVEFT